MNLLNKKMKVLVSKTLQKIYPAIDNKKAFKVKLQNIEF